MILPYLVLELCQSAFFILQSSSYSNRQRNGINTPNSSNDIVHQINTSYSINDIIDLSDDNNDSNNLGIDYHGDEIISINEDHESS
jgi:hypothetical protein